MFELAQCPACGKFAASPAEWPADRLVRCPHCLAEYLLSQASLQSLPHVIPASDGSEATEEQVAAIAAADPPTVDEVASPETVRPEA